MWNILLVQFSYLLSNLLKRPVIWGKPWFVSIEPSSVCNLSCPQCPVGEGDISREKKFLDMEEYKKILAEIAPATALLSLYFQGEPLLHKQFPEFVSLASAKGIFTQTSTNGQLLSPDVCREIVLAGLDRMIVSVDGFDQESYETYRKGGNLEQVEEGIRNLVNIRKEYGRKNPRIVLQFLVFRHNRDQVPEVKRKAKNLGADSVWIKSVQIEYPETADQWIPDTQDYNRYERTVSAGSNPKGNKAESEKWKLKGRQRNRCKRLWQTTVICSDGLVVPCCFDKRAIYSAGRTTDNSLAEIWKSKSYRDFRKRVLNDRKSISICMNCTEGAGRVFH